MASLPNSTQHEPHAQITSSSPADSVLSTIAALLQNLNGWSLLFATVIAIVVYDQGNKPPYDAIDSVKYQFNSKGIAGPRFKIPVMGSFLDSLHPTFEGYLSKWESGPLSCVSVFHKFFPRQHD